LEKCYDRGIAGVLKSLSLGMGKGMSYHPFDLLMELDTDQIRLDCAALHLARDVYPTLNIRRYLEQLDALAAAVADLRPGLSANLRYEALRQVIADQHGLIGNEEHYYDPANSYLNHVLDTRRGIPISLSIVWLEVGRRLKWPMGGVALPGHFIVRFDDRERFVLADPFNAGRTLTLDDCQNLVERSFEGKVRFSLDYLKPVNTRGILLRLLRNLRNIYLTHNDLPRVADILLRMSAVEPGNGRHLQDLAAVCCRRGDVRGAAAHLELYLHRSPKLAPIACGPAGLELIPRRTPRR
jgi:regulator of sirC expression with transglutaminase-like and TPR domain